MLRPSIAALLVLAAAIPLHAQEGASFRQRLEAPILFTAADDDSGPPDNGTNNPLTLTASGFPAWAAVNTSVGGTLSIAGGTAPYALPVIDGASQPFGLTPSDNGDGTWSVTGQWSTPGTFSFFYRTTDADDEPAQTLPISVEVSDPLAVVSGSITTRVNSSVDYGAVTGGYSLGRDVQVSGAPGWLAFDEGLGSFTGTAPATADSGTISISAADGFNTASGSLSYNILPQPVASYSGNASGDTTTAMSVTASLSDPIGAVTWAEVSGSLPPGLTRAAGSPTIAGTPTTAGNYSVTLRGTDTTNAYADVTIPFTITASSNWTAATTLSTKAFTAITFGAARTIAIASNGEVWRSDASLASWTASGSLGSSSCYDLAYSNGGYFLALCYSGSASTTISIGDTSGSTWTLRNQGTSGWRGVAAGHIASVGDRLVIVGPNKAARTYSGTSWDNATGVPSGSWEKVAYGNGRFIAIQSTTTNQAMTSTDGLTWSTITLPESRSYTAIAHGNGRWFAFATGYVATSTDGGVTWTGQNTAEANTWRSMAYGNGHYVAVASSGTNRIMTSTDGQNWTLKPAPAQSAWQDLVWTGQGFQAVANADAHRLMRATNP